jgi:hypothetical protein
VDVHFVLLPPSGRLTISQASPSPPDIFYNHLRQISSQFFCFCENGFEFFLEFMILRLPYGEIANHAHKRCAYAPMTAAALPPLGLGCRLAKSSRKSSMPLSLTIVTHHVMVLAKA